MTHGSRLYSGSRSSQARMRLRLVPGLRFLLPGNITRFTVKSPG
jgi:hypothetical protein